MSKYILKDFPDSSSLLSDFQSAGEKPVLQVNTHVHTPYSFSYFNNIQDIFKQAAAEGLSALGINDFFTTDGFDEFYEISLGSRIFPIFNIEITGLIYREQYEKFRINDPVNPGRIYLSGKGLDYPVCFDEECACMLNKIRYENQLHTKEIIENANRYLKETDSSLQMKYSEVKRLYAKEIVTERHVSRAIRNLVFNRFEKPEERKNCLMDVLGTDDYSYDILDPAVVENEIRARFLKAGGKAFVAEEHGAFLPVEEVKHIILRSGGIPCYSVLLDDEKGQCTEYEANKQILLNELLSHNIRCIEFIPHRNRPDVLKDYALFFRNNDFLVLFGTAHSTPDKKPLRITTRDNRYLDDELSFLSYESCAVIAAHQYLRAREEQGYIDSEGNWNSDKIKEFALLGKAVIHRFIHSR